jgi:hypothetical protein
MALLATQVGVQTGLLPVFGAVNAGGDTFQPGDDVSLYVKNPTGGAITVTVASQVQCNQGSTHNLAVAIPAGSERIIGPLPASRFADGTGVGSITYSAGGCTIAVIRP